jgi:hypothetical protein
MWIDDGILRVEWSSPLSSDELQGCFMRVAQMVSYNDQPVDIVFDVSGAGHIPVDAPMLAARSGVLNHPKTRNVAVVGLDHWAQILANVASRTSGKSIIFYRSYEEAVHALYLCEMSIT